MKQQTLCMVLLLLLLNSVQAQPSPNLASHQPPTPRQRLQQVFEALDKSLTLNTTQKQQVVAAYTAFFTDMEKHRGKDAAMPPPPPVPKAIADKLSGERDAKIKAALNEVQYKKYVELEKTLRPKHGSKRGENDQPKSPNE
jgi:hypothetical protein